MDEGAVGDDLKLRVFLSSPGDVAEERELARAVITNLPKEPQFQGRLVLEEVSWDNPGATAPLAAHLTPQEAINQRRPKPSQCDIVLVILWARMGTPLPADEYTKGDGTAYLSGAEWEYLDAIEATKVSGTPTVFIYWRQEKLALDPDAPDIDEVIEQRRRVHRFFENFRKSDGSLQGSYHHNASPSEFAPLLEDHLREVIWGRLKEAGLEAPPDSMPAARRAYRVSPDAEALRTAYLKRLMAQTGELSLAGIDPSTAEHDTHLSLRAVYMALMTTTTILHVVPGDPDPSLPPVKGRTDSALEQLDIHAKLVLLGDAGSGKSTFVNFVAHCLAGEGLGNEVANRGLLTRPLPEESGEASDEPQPWSHGTLLPVRVILRDFAARGLPAAGESATGRHLWDFLERELHEAELGDYVDHLRKEMLEHGALLLFDGLDEVPEAEHRREQLKDAIGDFISGLEHCRVLVTSRPYAYARQDWRLTDFHDATLAPLGDGEIRRFVSAWYTHAASLGRVTNEEATGRAAALEHAIFTQPRLRELAARPLLLTLMASLHAWRGGDLPDQREELYADAMELLLFSWDRRLVRLDEHGKTIVDQPSLAEWLQTDRDAIQRVLEAQAFTVHGCQPPEERGTADIAENDLVTKLLGVSANPDARPARLVEYLRDRAGLLTARGVGVYTFVHRTFQEYLAACHLTRDGYPEEVARLGRAEPDRWREVVLLAAARASRGMGAGAWLLVDELCVKTHDAGETTDEDSWGAHLAGQVLVESADLERVSAANQVKLERVRGWLVRFLDHGELPERERALAGDNLARIGDPRPGVGLTPEGLPDIVWCDVPGGTVKLEDEAGTFNVDAFRIAKYPVTVAQYQVFLDAEDGYGDPTWWGGLAKREDEPGEQYWAFDNRPVVNVSWYAAVAYCRWLSAQCGQPARLPTEREWQQAATGGNAQNVYPWGAAWQADCANSAESAIGQTSAVGMYPLGAASTGAYDMSGNVWEWCANKDDPVADVDLGGDSRRVTRGGSWSDFPEFMRSATRSGFTPEWPGLFIGFRLAQDME